MRVIVHLSDIHFGRVDPATIEPLASAISRRSPHLLAVSGDLTQRARRREFAAARAWLDALPYPRLAVPGNHDLPLWPGWRRAFRPLRRFRRAFGPEMPVYRDGDLAVIGVNTARAGTVMSGRLS